MDEFKKLHREIIKLKLEIENLKQLLNDKNNEIDKLKKNNEINSKCIQELRATSRNFGIGCDN